MASEEAGQALNSEDSAGKGTMEYKPKCEGKKLSVLALFTTLLRMRVKSIAKLLSTLRCFKCHTDNWWNENYPSSRPIKVTQEDLNRFKLHHKASRVKWRFAHYESATKKLFFC